MYGERGAGGRLKRASFTGKHACMCPCLGLKQKGLLSMGFVFVIAPPMSAGEAPD